MVGKRITRIRKKLAFIFQSNLSIEPTLVCFAEPTARPNLNAPEMGRADQNQIQATLLKALLVRALSAQEVDRLTDGAHTANPALVGKANWLEMAATMPRN